MDEDIEDLKRKVDVLQEQLARKEKEIEKLKKENLILLKVSLKQSQENLHLSEQMMKKLNMKK